MSDGIAQVKHALDSVSPCFCLAKWTQVTIHLHNGTTHSCHHPIVHRIPLEELAENPSALHNTSYKIKQRELMLQGIRPAECNYCWRIEDASQHSISDRIFKSGFNWSLPFKDEILADPLSTKVIPRYVEINLGNKCNFKCSYCSPESSSRWMAEVNQLGPYPTSGRHPVLNPDKMPIAEDDENPYLEAWWKWWPELYPQLHTFRITGGEPLLNKNFYRTLDWIRDHPNPNLNFGINTNLCPSPEAWNKFVAQAKSMSESGAVRRVEIYTSAEAWAEKAEYARHGMDFQMWRSRVWQVLEELPLVRVTIMATYNALSVTSFQRLLEELLRMKSRESFYNPSRLIPVYLDVSYLRSPEFQTIKILPPELRSAISDQVEFMKANPETKLPDGTYKRGFMPFETEKMERILKWSQAHDPLLDQLDKKKLMQQDFFRFFSEHDRRRGSDFLRAFPEMENFWRELGADSESAATLVL